jgi:hypothetical protein
MTTPDQRDDVTPTGDQGAQSNIREGDSDAATHPAVTEGDVPTREEVDRRVLIALRRSIVRRLVRFDGANAKAKRDLDAARQASEAAVSAATTAERDAVVTQATALRILSAAVDDAAIQYGKAKSVADQACREAASTTARAVCTAISDATKEAANELGAPAPAAATMSDADLIKTLEWSAGQALENVKFLDQKAGLLLATSGVLVKIVFDVASSTRQISLVPSIFFGTLWALSFALVGLVILKSGSVILPRGHQLLDKLPQLSSKDATPLSAEDWTRLLNADELATLGTAEYVAIACRVGYSSDAALALLHLVRNRGRNAGEKRKFLDCASRLFRPALFCLALSIIVRFIAGPIPQQAPTSRITRPPVSPPASAFDGGSARNDRPERAEQDSRTAADGGTSGGVSLEHQDPLRGLPVHDR